MSLIADALDAAQRERAKRAGVRHAAIPAGPSSFRSVAKRNRPAIPRQVAISMGIFAVVVVVAAMISMATASSRRAIQPSAVAAAPPLPLPTQTPIVDTMPSLSVQQRDTVAIATAPEPRPVPYERSVGVYPNSVPTRPSQPSRMQGSSDSSGVGEQNIAPQRTFEPRGAFKITMQGGPPARGRDDQLFQQGLAAQQRGDLSAARDLYSRALGQNPGNADILNNLGAVYRAMGDVTAAEDAYRRALDIDPRLAAAWTNLAVVLDAQGKKQEATAALQESLRLDPRNVSTKVNLAIQFSALALLPEARRLLEEALKENPALSEAHYTLGQVLEKQTNRAQAIAEYRLFLSTSAGRFPKQEEQVRQHLKAIGAESGNQ